jgi:hypothetical protein
MPESINFNNPNSYEPNTSVLEHEMVLTNFLNSQKTLFALLSKDAKFKISFTQDPEVTGYMEPSSKSIVLGTRWMAENNLNQSEALFVPVHEFGHADNMMEEGAGYIESFATLQNYCNPIKVWFADTIESKNKKLTQNQKNNLNNYIDKKYFQMWNTIDDIAINRWAVNQVPSLSRENTLEGLYKNHLFPCDEGTIGADYTKAPLHEQYQNYLLRSEMVSDSVSPTIIDPEVQSLIENSSHRTILSSDILSVKEIVKKTTNKVKVELWHTKIGLILHCLLLLLRSMN